MHLVENFALAAGVKIGKPTIEPLYFPIGGEYITIHNSSGMESKNYDYYKDVVSIIKPYIKNIKIIQIGQKGERIIEGTTSLLGETSLRQAAYLLMNSKLHIGNDSFACHIAGAYETPLVALYGPTHKSTCSPFWGDKEKQALLSPDYSSRKPSWAAKEIKKRVNEIFPDNVAMHALNLLKINNKLDLIVSYNTNSANTTYNVVSANDGTNLNTTLNFSPYHLITGVNLIDDLLFFTDNINPPRYININRF